MPALLTSSSGRQSARLALELEVEEREVSQPSLTEVGSQGFVVRQLPHLCAELGIEEYTDPNRPIWSSHLLRVYSGGSSVRMFALQTSPMSRQKTGDHSTSTSRSVSPFSSCYPHGCPGDDLPQDSAHSTTRYAPFKTPSHTPRNRSPASKLARLVRARQVSKSASRRFLRYSSSILTASDMMWLQVA